MSSWYGGFPNEIQLRRKQEEELRSERESAKRAYQEYALSRMPAKQYQKGLETDEKNYKEILGKIVKGKQTLYHAIKKYEALGPQYISQKERALQDLSSYEETENMAHEKMLKVYEEGISLIEKTKEKSMSLLDQLSSAPFKYEKQEEEDYLREWQILQKGMRDRLSELKIEKAGRDGERKVEYVLRWLQPAGYKSVTKDCISKYNNNCIILRNNSFIDESQEFDHIVVGRNGVFLIETKNFTGTIRIDSYGDWTQEKSGERKGIKNPVQQSDRHSALLRSIIGNFPIVSIICIANDGVIIEGRENCVVPIVSVALLQRHIENTISPYQLTEDQINQTIKMIDKHKVDG